TGDCFGINDMLFFFVLYLLGGFIRLHVDVDKIDMKKLVLICLSCLILTTIIFGGFDSTPLSQLSTFNKETSIFKQTYSIFIVTSAITLFLIFVKRKEFSNKYINYISGSVLGVYLIHSNVFVWPWLFRSFLHAQTRINSPNLFIFCIVSTILIYLVCTGIDIVRRLTVEKVWIWVVDNKLNNIPQWFNQKFEIFEKKISYYLK
ncbi:MAG: acyltransferase family protein, partial [Methanobrevibacter sp.]|nr:acyltransferase family protein [Methanobrevibacter sp.]